MITATILSNPTSLKELDVFIGKTFYVLDYKKIGEQGFLLLNTEGFDSKIGDTVWSKKLITVNANEWCLVMDFNKATNKKYDMYWSGFEKACLSYLEQGKKLIVMKTELIMKNDNNYEEEDGKEDELFDGDGNDTVYRGISVLTIEEYINSFGDGEDFYCICGETSQYAILMGDQVSFLCERCFKKLTTNCMNILR